MRWIIGLLIGLPLPLLPLFVALTGTTGKAEPMYKYAAICFPIFLCGIYGLYRLIKADHLVATDWIAIVIAPNAGADHFLSGAAAVAARRFTPLISAALC